jgi:hypothetical protein
MLQRQLEVLPKQAEDDDTRLLEEMVRALNNQKRRCLKLWQAGCLIGSADGPGTDLDQATRSLMDEPITTSIEAATLSCLDRELPPDVVEDVPDEKVDITACSAPSLVFAAESLQQPFSAEVGGESTFTIPLTLGMGDFAGASHKASCKRSLTIENLMTSATVRRKVVATL